MSKPLLIIELVGLYVLLPALFYLNWLPRAYMFVALLSVAVYVVVVLLHNPSFATQQLWHFSGRALLRPILLRFGVAAGLLTIFTVWYYPDLLLRFPSEKPRLWGMVMLLYPLLSAYPQEVISRLFFFHRYTVLFPNINSLFIVNAALFAWMHIMFESILVLVLSFIGGLFFAHTYHQSRSVMLVTLEHALYGNFLFTLGLGWFFFHGWLG